MRLTLRKLIEDRGMKLEYASKLFEIKAGVLKDYMEYKRIPEVPDLKIILRMFRMDYDDIIFIIYRDFEEHYRGP